MSIWRIIFLGFIISAAKAGLIKAGLDEIVSWVIAFLVIIILQFIKMFLVVKSIDEYKPAILGVATLVDLLIIVPIGITGACYAWDWNIIVTIFVLYSVSIWLAPH